MDFGFTKEEEALRQEVREFLKREATPEVNEEVESGKGLGPHAKAILRKLGAKRWLAPHWPPEFGGMGASYIQRFIIKEELAYFSAPHTLVGADMAGPTILLFGNQEQKEKFLPPIARGEVEYALGYTEPHAGSDLAALDIRAVDQGDHFRVNGQKVFNTATHYADYHWLGARTDTTVPQHKGISLFIVPLTSPGITINPIWTMDGGRTNAGFYDDVKVPKANMVGQMNRGWYHIAAALDFERNYSIGHIKRALERLAEFVADSPQKDDQVTRRKLADLAVETEVAYLFSARVAWMIDRGFVPNYEAAMVKAFASELENKVAQAGMELLGLYGQLQRHSERAPMDGWVDHWYMATKRSLIVRGTSDVMRNIIALRGLGLPRE
ncbi:MAG: acyl-CoA dehydrogenase family protein [Chloroflexota bacterium]